MRERSNLKRQRSWVFGFIHSDEYLSYVELDCVCVCVKIDDDRWMGG